MIVGTEESDVAEQVVVQVHGCIVVGLRQLQVVGSKSETAAQVEVQVNVCIVVGLHQLQIVGSKSEVTAQVEVQVHVCVLVSGWATDSALRRDEHDGRLDLSSG